MKIILCGISALCALGLISCKGYTKPGEQQQGSDANSIFGVGGSEKEWKTSAVEEYSIWKGGITASNGSQKSDAEITAIKDKCSKYAKGGGADVRVDFKKNGGCGLGCDPADYSFVGTMKLSGEDGGTYHNSCFIKPHKMTVAEKCQIPGAHCCQTPRGLFPPGKLPWGPYTCLPNGKCDTEDDICR